MGINLHCFAVYAHISPITLGFGFFEFWLQIYVYRGKYWEKSINFKPSQVKRVSKTSPISPSRMIQGKTRESKRSIKRSVQEASEPQWLEATTGWPWWALARRFCRLPNSAFWCMSLVRGFYLGSSALGLLGLFCNLSWLGLASISILSPNIWLHMCKSAIKTRKSQNSSIYRKAALENEKSWRKTKQPRGKVAPWPWQPPQAGRGAL